MILGGRGYEGVEEEKRGDFDEIPTIRLRSVGILHEQLWGAKGECGGVKPVIGIKHSSDLQQCRGKNIGLVCRSPSLVTCKYLTCCRGSIGQRADSSALRAQQKILRKKQKPTLQKREHLGNKINQLFSQAYPRLPPEAKDRGRRRVKLGLVTGKRLFRYK